jgi:hypothetical protein
MPSHTQHRYTPYPAKKPEHPHCLQASRAILASVFHDILQHGNFPREKYESRDKREYTSSVLHRGQRKLLMSEIGALVRLDPAQQYTAVYAGAAPGVHTPLLSELFPNIVFHLYDPAPFRIKETERIKLFNTYFTDNTARRYTSATYENLVFICDIRSTPDEFLVWEDMQAQRRWHEIMQPKLTSLKFRLPWPGHGVANTTNQVEYLEGDIHLPVWGPHNTTESRLVIEQNRHRGTRIYDCLAYEEEMCYFNRVTRPSVHKWQTRRNDGLDGCYDCTAELSLLQKYEKIWGHTQLTTARISRELQRDIYASTQDLVGGGSKKPPSKDVWRAITCYDSMKHIKLDPPTEIEHPPTHLLVVMSEDYRLLGKLTPYTDSSGKTYPLDSWMEIVPAVNRCMKTCVKGKMIKTFLSDDTRQPAPLPSGMHMFSAPCELTECLIKGALCDAHEIYWNPKHRANKMIHMIEGSRAPACNLLFYPGCSQKNPRIEEVFQVLFAEAPSLARYALMYLSLIRDILKLDDEELGSVTMALNHYDPKAGINPHVDTVFMFNGTLGPIFTVAMGPTEKLLDLIPVLLPDSYKPVRIFSKPNELMLMDGEARTLWAHSKPLNYPHEQFTLVFKCPEYRTKTHTVPFEFEGTSLDIPYHYVSPSETATQAPQ